MKKFTGLIILAALAVLLSGCVINLGISDYTFVNNSTVDVTVTYVRGGTPSSFTLKALSGKQIVEMTSSVLDYDYTPKTVSVDPDTFNHKVTFSGWIIP